jgi:hypothetical protein
MSHPGFVLSGRLPSPLRRTPENGRPFSGFFFFSYTMFIFCLFPSDIGQLKYGRNHAGFGPPLELLGFK